MTPASTTTPTQRLPPAIWALGFVSLLMDISSEMIHSLLPVFMVTVLGTSLWAVGLIEGAAEATALIVKVFSGVLSDYWGKRKPLALLGYGLGAASKPLFALATTTGLVLAAHPIKALAHITGGGLLENIPRVLPEGMAAHLVKGSWPQTELFAWLQNTAGIDDTEMNRTFNNGIGMVVVIDAANAVACADMLSAAGETVHTIGVIAPIGQGAAVVVS